MSAPDRRLVLDPLAELDFQDIFLFTAERWDDARAEEYVEAIRVALGRLVAFPHLGELFGPALPQVRRLVIGQHAAFYQVDGQRVYVLRILHQRMQPGRHLPR
jgi:toxin ParE1/3/4